MGHDLTQTLESTIPCRVLAMAMLSRSPVPSVTGKYVFFTPAAECKYKSCSGSSHVIAGTAEVTCILDGVVMLPDIPRQKSS
jgi:hypothetical protein